MFSPKLVLLAVALSLLLLSTLRSLPEENFFSDEADAAAAAAAACCRFPTI